VWIVGICLRSACGLCVVWPRHSLKCCGLNRRRREWQQLAAGGVRALGAPGGREGGARSAGAAGQGQGPGARPAEPAEMCGQSRGEHLAIREATAGTRVRWWSVDPFYISRQLLALLLRNFSLQAYEFSGLKALGISCLQEFSEYSAFQASAMKASRIVGFESLKPVGLRCPRRRSFQAFWLPCNLLRL